MGNQAGIIIRNVKNELFHSANRLILNEVKGIECLHIKDKNMKIKNHFDEIVKRYNSNRFKLEMINLPHFNPNLPDFFLDNYKH